MLSQDRILIVSRSREAARAVRDVIADARELAVETRLIDSRQPDPLHGVAQRPDLLLLRVGADWTAELDALEHHAPENRPPLIVIGDAADAQCMRVAMRVGARDFLTEPLARDDLLAAIKRVTGEHRSAKRTHNCRLTAFVNAKGGSGATFLAANIAYLFASVEGLRTALLDLDLQFGSLPKYLDIQPERGLLEALDVAEDLDGVAINGYLTRHQTGLAVLAGLPRSTALHQELVTDRFDAVLNVLIENFERLVIDVPRHIGPFAELALARADQIVLVLQQSVPSLHDATRMHDILTRSLGVPTDNIRIVVNRYRKNASVEIADVAQALGDKELICVPNDFRAVTESTDMGIPLYECARRSATTKALLQLKAELNGHVVPPARGFLPGLLKTA
jgi:pilus assembly protein CpaE